jgi:hypothetical protein
MSRHCAHPIIMLSDARIDAVSAVCLRKRSASLNAFAHVVYISVRVSAFGLSFHKRSASLNAFAHVVYILVYIVRTCICVHVRTHTSPSVSQNHRGMLYARPACVISLREPDMHCSYVVRRPYTCLHALQRVREMLDRLLCGAWRHGTCPVAVCMCDNMLVPQCSMVAWRHGTFLVAVCVRDDVRAS